MDSATQWDTKFDEILRSHLTQLAPDQPLTPDLKLRANGLDSLGTVNLLMELEDSYGIEIPDERLTYELFDSPTTLWHTVAQLRGTY
jgi:acyl carrier protein